ncbi:MAG: TAT-variant-translocated molybdopterin oxidoreductase [Phycisphaerales bacterium]
MSNSDQCPSTIKEGPKQKKSKQELSRERRSLLASVNGRPAWRSIEEVEDTSEFREFLEREFPAGVTDFLSGTRRTFMKIMGASFALAGAATLPGCRRPDHKILAYSQHPPEDIIPGKPLFYATSMPIPGGGCEGLLVETHEGRPTKIEGNPLHPVNRGRSSVNSQASILSMYDPDRLKEPVFFNRKRNNGAGEKIVATWDDFVKWGKDYFPRFDKTQGAGLAIVVDRISSPTRDALRDQILKKWPKATWIAYDATENLGPARGTEIAFGAPMHEAIDFSKAKVVVSFGRDFLDGETRSLVHARDFASTRRVEELTDPMSRLYVVESGFSLTGGQADHRLRATPTKVLASLVEFARFALPKLGGGAEAVVAALGAISVPAGILTDSDRKFIEEAAIDAMERDNKGRTIVLAGAFLPPSAHALCHALNAALGSTLVGFTPMSPELATDSRAALSALTQGMKAGKYESVLCLGTNPAYNAPDWKAFSEAFAKLEGSVSLSVGLTETSELATWNLNGCHYLESWGDTVSSDGVIAPVQPMISPLYAAVDSDGNRAGQAPMSDLEMLAFVAGDLRTDGTPRDGYELVRRTWRGLLGTKTDGDLEKAWKRALHDGVVAGTGVKPSTPKVNLGAVATALKDVKLTPASGGALEAIVRTNWMNDGRNTNISWLQELPQHGTAVVWDNPAVMSPKTADALGVLPASATLQDPEPMYTKQKYPLGHVAEFTFDGRMVKCAVWILPGMADDTVLFLNGYGRRKAGLVADGVGFDIGPLRGNAGAWLPSVTCKPTGEMHQIASTQMHWSLEGRTAIVRQVDLPTYQKFGGEAIPDNDTIYADNSSGKLNFAERLGELSHTPPNNSIYINPFTRSAADVDPNDPDYLKMGGWPDKQFRKVQPPDFAQRHQWGMTIDLSSCTGCGACTIACQAENNIPVVGKKEVMKGREMHWIRVDRYFAGSYFDHENPGKLDYNAPEFMFHQPVACVHCENAPCETVCPVNATVHGNEGHNFMTYNRCIGTRYCANNCPYKVRRFNFFEYGLTKFNGGYIGQEFVDSIAPNTGGITGSGEHNKINPNLIPPRLRDKLDQITRMQKNPDVTTRMRGIMEKCSYCIQRTNSAKIEVRLQDLQFIPDGFVQSACQQACPSDAIVFGDILDNDEYTNPDGSKRKGSRVSHTRRSRRSYLLLGYLNTRPRTSHMIRVNNPNPKLVDETRKKAWDHPFHGGHDAGHEGGHNDSHGAEQPKEHAFFDRRRKAEDKGYALSLNILSGGGHA